MHRKKIIKNIQVGAGICLLAGLFLLVGGFTQTQKFVSRTGHIHVKSTSRFMDVVADNYQVYAEINPADGNIQLTGLMKSFEFKLGALDRAFNSDRIDLSQYTKFSYQGRLTNVGDINFSRLGTYTARVSGNLFIGNYKRLTSAVGTVEVLPNGRIRADADFDIRIEEASMETINRLMRERLPKVVALDTDNLGISRDIELQLVANLRLR